LEGSKTKYSDWVIRDCLELLGNLRWFDQQIKLIRFRLYFAKLLKKLS
jgi:hypothetical protein